MKVLTEQKFSQDTQKLERYIKNDVLIFNDKTTDVEFVNLSLFEPKRTDIEIKEVIFETEQLNLKYLDLGRQKIKKLVVKGTPTLERLFLHDCGLDELHFEGLFPNLKVIDISKNNLNWLDLSPENFPALQAVYFEKNKLTSLDFVATFLLRDENFDIGFDKNPITKPPAEIVEQGREAIIRYYESIKVENKEVKIILLGNTTTGKTSLVKYLTEKEYSPEKTTHGIKNTLWKSEYNGFDFIATIWDFGGQEYYHATHRLFLTNNSFYLVVWNKDKNKNAVLDTKIYTYNGLEIKKLQHFHYEYWLRNIRNRFAPDAEIIMVQNKIDLTGEENIPPDIMQKYNIENDFKISLEKAANKDLKYEQKYNLFETELKEYVVSFIRRYAPEGEKAGMIPRYIYNIRNAVREKWTENFISFNEFKKRAKNTAEAGGDKIDDFDIQILLKYLHDTGVLLYYGYQENINSELLKNIVFLNPNYVTETIYKILDEKSVLENKGKFSFNLVVEKTNDENTAKLFIDLMLSPNFELIFKYQDYYYASQFLPETNEVIEFNKNKYDFAFALRFPKYFSVGFITRFISRYAPLTQNAAFSRTEVLITVDKNIDFYVYADIEKETITVKTTEQGKKERFIRKIFEDILKIADAYDFFIETERNLSQYEYIEDLSNDEKVELCIDGKHFIPIKHIRLYDLKNFEIDRVFEPLSYEIKVRDNYIKVEGNGNIILQNVQGKEITVNLNNWGDLEEKLRGEHNEILQAIETLKDLIKDIIPEQKMELVMQKLERIETHLDKQDEKLDAINLQLDVFAEKISSNDLQAIQKVVADMNTNLSKGMITLADEIFKYIDYNLALLTNDIKSVYSNAKKKEPGVKLGVGLSVLKLLDLTGLPIGTVMQTILDAAKLDVSTSKSINKLFKKQDNPNN